MNIKLQITAQTQSKMLWIAIPIIWFFVYVTW